MAALLLIAAMLVAAGLGYSWSRIGSLSLIVLSAFWIFIDVRPEGPILWTITRGHGVVASDLWGLAGLLAGAALLIRGPRLSA